MTSKTFADFGLPDFLVSTLADAGFTNATPIQAKAIPAQLEGRDIMGIAQTGSGKTAAFSLPILAGVFAMRGKPEPKAVRALVLAPTRELAVQIDEMIRLYAGNRRISTVLVLGGMSRHAQIQKIARGTDVVIATPGRLSDLYDDRKIRLDQVKYFVLDEADRMLDMGFIGQVRNIASAIGPDRQTALFSATMAPEIEKLAKSLLNDPVRVEAAPQGTTVGKIEQSVIFAPTKQKRDGINTLLADEAAKKVIVFARTKHGADRVAKNLEIDGHSVAAIHGNKSQNSRQAALKGFRDGKVRVLVATDIAARGIDVPDITHVINYELPDDAENYVHRIGRTARNGASGIAISLVGPEEKSKLREIEKLIRITLVKSGDAGALPAGGTSDRPVKQRRPAHGAPRKGAANRRGGNTGAPTGGKKQWWAQLDAAPSEKGDGETREGGKPKRSGAKKPRWSKGQRDAGRSQRQNENRGAGRGRSAA